MPHNNHGSPVWAEEPVDNPYFPMVYCSVPGAPNRRKM
jgi:hypothetical protein